MRGAHPAEIDDVVAAIRATGASALSQRCDVAVPDDLRRLYDVTRQTYGRLDVVIANAGGNFARQPLEDSDIEAWEHTIRVNLLGVYYTARFAIPDLKVRGGHIIVVGSGLGHRVGDNTHSAYSASKAGAWMLVRALAKELSPYKICVNELIRARCGPSYSRARRVPPIPRSRPSGSNRRKMCCPWRSSSPRSADRANRAELQLDAPRFAVTSGLQDGEYRLQILRLGEANWVVQRM